MAEDIKITEVNANAWRRIAYWILKLLMLKKNIITRTLKQVLSISRTTARESMQEPVAFLIFLSAVLITVLVPVFQFNRFSEEGRLARDSGLSTMLVFGLVLAAGTAGRAVAGEIESGTAAAIIGKPVSRVTFLLSKALGVFWVVCIFWVGMLCATLVAERISARFVTAENFAGHVTDRITLIFALGIVLLVLLLSGLLHYIRRRSFGLMVFIGIALGQALVVLGSGFYSRLGKPFYVFGQTGCGCGNAHHHEALERVIYDPELNMRIIPAALLVLFALAVFVCLAAALATRLQSGAAIVVCAFVLMVGLTGDTFAFNENLLSWRLLPAGLLPDVQHFWMCDALASGGRIAAGYLWQAGLYALTCCALFLTAGCISFQNRDLG
jgi:ABC-type transport system involved in multi-copper enzyme maturation permease subunit